MLKKLLAASLTKAATLVSVGILILGYPGGTAKAYDHIQIFSATKDKKLYDRDRTRYGWVIPYVGRKNIYVEKLSIAKISTTEVKSVVIQKEELLKLPGDEASGADRPEDTYFATFYMGFDGARNLKELTKNRVGKWIAIALDEELVTPTIILEPIAGEQFSIGLMDRNPEQIRKLFMPLKDKVTWK